MIKNLLFKSILIDFLYRYIRFILCVLICIILCLIFILNNLYFVSFEGIGVGILVWFFKILVRLVNIGFVVKVSVFL